MAAIATSLLRLLSAYAALAATAPALAGDARFAPYVDAPTAAVEAKSLDGRPLSIGVDGAKVTLVHFFASWCEPCEDELPALAAFARSNAADVRLIGVAVAEPASRARTFLAKFGLPAEVATDPDTAVARAFGVRGLPATVALAAEDGPALAAEGPVDWTSPETAGAISGLATTTR